MKVLFIAQESIMHERIGIMSLSSCLKMEGNTVKLVLADSLGTKGLLHFVATYSPAVVGYSAMTGEHARLLEINKLLKQHFSFIAVFGGPHATFFPDLINEESIDAVCVGEGDRAFPQFCRRLERDEKYWETPNFTVKYKGEIFKNPTMPLIEDLDSLPFPDRDLMYAADPNVLADGKKFFFASRGCPYECSYCFNEKYNELYLNKGNVVRLRSPDSIIEEIQSVKNAYPLNVVYIDDDTFLVKPHAWFMRFSQLYKEKINLPLSCNVRANLVTEEIVALLKDGGLDSVWIGIECGNEEIANKVLNRNLKNSHILDAVNTLKKYNIKIITQNLIGIPIRNSYQVDLETLDFNIKLNPTFAWSSLLYPYPGTQIARYAKDNNFLTEDAPFLETNKRFTLFNYDKIDKRKIENLHKLFGVIVRFSFLQRVCDFLCDLSLSGFYTCLYYLWYGYNLKVKILPFRSFRGEIKGYFCLWLRMIRKK